MKIEMRNRCESAYAAQFNALIEQVFGFTFQPWFDLDQWRENYEIYSIWDAGCMLACVGVYKAPVLVRGKPVDALQIGAVAVRPDRRGQGLMRRLMEHVQAAYPGVPQHLHANASVVGFYPRFGFRRVIEHAPSIRCLIDNQLEPLKLRLGDERLTRALMERDARSRVMDFFGTQSVQVFHLVMDYGDAIYHIPALDAVVIAEQDGARLSLHDVIAKAPIRWDELVKQLPFSGVEEVRFGFTPDWLGIAPDWTPIADDDEAMFVLGDWDLPDVFRMPVTSLT